MKTTHHCSNPNLPHSLYNCMSPSDMLFSTKCLQIWLCQQRHSNTLHSNEQYMQFSCTSHARLMYCSELSRKYLQHHPIRIVWLLLPRKARKRTFLVYSTTISMNSWHVPAFLAASSICWPRAVTENGMSLACHLRSMCTSSSRSACSFRE
jgi:hypothetical protein